MKVKHGTVKPQGYISGDHPVLENPITSTELADFLEETYRPFFPSSSAPTTIYVATTGNDTTGTGSSGNPYATILKALQIVAIANSNNPVTIQLADAGPFDLPSVWIGNSLVTVKGTSTVEESRTATTVSVDANEGIVFTVDGATLADDAWRDRHLNFPNLFGGVRNAIVKRNVGNTIYAVMYANTTPANPQNNPNGQQVDLLSFTELQHQTSLVNYGLSNFLLIFQNIKLTGNSNFLMKAGDDIRFWQCQIESRQIHSSRCNIQLYSTSLAGVGDTTNGFLLASFFGEMTTGYGFVFSDRNATSPDTAFARFRENSNWKFIGINFFRGLGKAIELDGAAMFDSGPGLSIAGYTVFDNDTGTPTCQAGFKINSRDSGNGGNYFFPVMSGEVLSDYLVEAERGAYCELPDGTNVTTATGTNTVSADAGATASSYNVADSTVIRGGSPAYIRRPDYNPAAYSSTIYVDADNGDDNFGDGTSGNRYQTIKRALMDIGENNNDLVFIYCAVATADYVIDQTITDWNNIYLVGEYTTGESRNITGVTTSSAARGQEFTVDGAALTSDWIGRTVLLNGQLSDAEAINIEHVSGNTIYGTMVKRSELSFTAEQGTMTATGTIQRINLPVLDFDSNAIQGSTALFFAFFRVTGSQQFVNSSDNVAFVKCEVEIPFVQVARGALFTFYQCNLLMEGDSNNGFFIGAEGGTARMGAGTVYTGLTSDRSTLATNRFFGARIGGVLQFFGGPILKRLTSTGIYNTGGRIEELTNTPTTNQQLFFSDNDATAICAKGFVLNVLPSFTAFAKDTAPAGQTFVPICSGEVSGDYFVEDQRGGYTEIRDGCSVTTNIGTNNVSADGGNNECAYYEDGTFIYGGSVSPFVLRTNIDPGYLLSTIYVDSTGDDIRGDGSVSSPYLTIQRAIQALPEQNTASTIIQLGDGTFSAPSVLGSLANVTIKGELSDEESALPVASITAQSNADQLVFDITRTPTLGDDDWRGRLIEFNNAGTLTYGWVYRNVGNTLYCGQTNNDLTSAQLTTSSTIDLVSIDTQLQFTVGNNSLTSSTAVNVQDLEMTGTGQGRIPFHINTDKWEYRRVLFTVNRPQFGSSGAGNVFNCYVQSLGDTTNGVLSVVSGGVLRIGQGTIIDGLSAASTEKFVRIAQEGTIAFDGPIIARDLGDGGFKFDGSSGFVNNGLADTDLILFEDTNGTTVGSCTDAIVINSEDEGVGGSYQLPYLYGSVNDAYAVKAEGGANVEMPSTSSLVTTGTTNAVSADGGTTTSSRNSDGTKIVGGSPVFSAGWTERTTVTSSTYTATENDNVIGVNFAGTVTITLPDATTLQSGSELTVVDESGNASSNNITLDGSGSQTINGSLTATINLDYMSLTVYTDGSNWFVK